VPASRSRDIESTCQTEVLCSAKSCKYRTAMHIGITGARTTTLLSGFRCPKFRQSSENQTLTGVAAAY